jgi:phosphate:Na+ symporter
MVIAFAGAGIITLSNSLGIVLGANLGTTFTGWLVTVLGFGRSSIDSFVYPMIGLGTLGLVFLSRRYVLYHVFAFIIAVGLFFMGLSFMKESMENLSRAVDLSLISGYGVWAFAIFGFLFTGLVQSSTATMMITLSALHAGMFDLSAAAGIIVGANLGSTITVLIGAARGSAIKKRVALGHFFFSAAASVMAFVFLKPLLSLIGEGFGITDPLMSLVMFHSLFNLIAILFFLPFLGSFEGFLNRFHYNGQKWACTFIHKVGTEVPEAALEAVRLELRGFSQRVYRFHSRLIGFQESEQKVSEVGLKIPLINLFMKEEDIGKEYELIKRIEGELLDYFVSLQKEELAAEESEALNQYILALRNGVQAAKATKDIQHNHKEFRQSVAPWADGLWAELSEDYGPVNERMGRIWQTANKQVIFEELARISSDNEQAYRRVNEWIYQSPEIRSETDVPIATFLNVNREIYSSNRQMIETLKDTFLPPTAAQNLSGLSESGVSG